MKLVAQLEDEGNKYELDLQRLLKLLNVKLSDSEILGKVLQEINRI